MPTSKRSKAIAPAAADVPDEDLEAEIADDLAERQQLDLAGRGRLGQRQREHASASPKLAGGDVDAAWDDSAGDGEEMVGGDTPTPDQDRVDDIGEGAGLTYQDDEPLNFDKVLARDQHRWELNAASASEADEDELEVEEDVDDLDELGLIDGEAESLEVLDVDDLADDEDEAEEIEEADLDDLDELEDDDASGPDDDEDEDDEENDDDEEDDDEEDDF
jgi:hypothetical protein